MSNFEFSFGASGQTLPPRRVADKMRLLILADCRGDSSNRPPLEARQPRKIDIDNFARLLKRWSPRVTLNHDNNAIDIVCPTLECLDPDSLYQRLEVFDALRQARQDIVSGKSIDTSTTAAAIEPAAGKEEVQDTLSRLLGDSAVPPQKKPGSGLLDAFIGKLVADDLAPAEGNKNAQLDACDSAIGELMRAVLHDPQWQRLEATWRGLHQMINALEADDILSVYVMDISAAELSEDLLEGDRQNSTLVTRLVEEGRGTFGGEPWDLVVADFNFTPAQSELIAALGALAKAAGGQLLADGDIRHLSGDASEDWQALRNSAAAKTVVLSTPRVLLRAPYGKQNDMPESFRFKECVGEPANEDLLWGSSALLIATCLAQQFELQEQRGNLSDQEAARDRPMYVFEKDGTRTVQPVAETLLSDREADALRKQWGVMPLRPERNGNRLLFPALQHLSAR